MALMTSPHPTDITPLDPKLPAKMASLDDQPVPASNGVNGRPYPASMSPEPTSVPLKTTEGADGPEKAAPVDAAENTLKNEDAYASNAVLFGQTPPATDVAKDNDDDVEKASEPVPVTGEAPPSNDTEKKEVSNDAVAVTAEAPAEAINPVADGEVSTIEAAKEQQLDDTARADGAREIQENAPGSAAKPDESGAETSAQAPLSASEAPATEASPRPSSPAPVAQANAAEAVMDDVPPEAPPALESVAVAAPEKPSTPAPAPAAHASVSSLLPSLRDDRSRETSSTPAVHDSIMAEAPTAKVSREREDDDEAGRSAKRAKTEDAESSSAATPSGQAKVEAVAAPEAASMATGGEMQLDTTPVVMPPRVRATAKEGSLADPQLDDQPISAYANRSIRRVLASVKKTKAGLNFKDPVSKNWPQLWESYTARVAKPMDISLLERNLRDNVYAVHADFINDLFLIFENSVSFNGLTNPVTDEAKSLVDNFFARLSEYSAQESQKSEKKEPKQLPTRQTEPRAAANRRESRGAATSPVEESVIAYSASPINVSTSFGPAPASAGASSPTGATIVATPAEAATPVFAVPSSGVPIIRRDSAKNDGDRPKRPIHPPKNRDLGYEPKNPKKKQPEFRFCEEVLKELMKAKHYEINHWFLKPVDPVAMQIPTYHKVIKKPMDLGTMQTKLNLAEYASAKDFESDFNLIVKNCRKFNVVGEVVDAANRLEDLFKTKWAEKDSWIAAHTAQAASVVSPAATKDDDSDEEDGDSEDDDEASMAPLSSETIDALVKRLFEENARLNKLLMAKVPDMTMITTQQTVANMIQKQIVEEKLKLAAAEAERRNKRASKAKTARGKKALGGSKKSGALGGKKAAAGGLAKRAPKARVFGQAEKNVVTDGINNLDGQQLERAIDIIKKDTSQEESESGELELDIDQLSQDALGKLYDLIVKAFPHMKVKVEKVKTSSVDASGQPVGKMGKPKKHKPMGKLEQERNIEKLREIKAQFQRPGSGSQEPLPSVEMNQAVEEEESEEESDVDSEEE